MTLPGTRSQRIALAVSVVLHLAALGLYGPLSALDIFEPDAVKTAAADAQPLVFELVETPDDAIRQKPDRADLLSDKDALARDEGADADLEEGDPYSEGQVEQKIFAGAPRTPQAEPAQPGGDSGAEDRGDEADGLEEQREKDAAGEISRAEESESAREGPQLPENPESAPDTRADTESRSSRERYTDALDFDQRISRAAERGGVTLNTYAWDYADYLYAMKAKLRSNTYPPSGFSLLGILTGEQVIRFRVMPDGTATEVTVIEYEGDRSLLDTSLDAIRLSSPFRPLPDDFPEEYLELTWTFIYYVHRR